MIYIFIYFPAGSKIVRCLGTEDRVKDPAQKIPANTNVIAFVSFPGNDIKDLFVHEAVPEAPPQNPPGREQAFPTQRSAPPSTAPAAKQEQAKPAPRSTAPAPSAPASASAPAPASQQHKPTDGEQKSSSAGIQARTRAQPSGVGTGQHLLHLRVRKVDGNCIALEYALFFTPNFIIPYTFNITYRDIWTRNIQVRLRFQCWPIRIQQIRDLSESSRRSHYPRAHKNRCLL